MKILIIVIQLTIYPSHNRKNERQANEVASTIVNKLVLNYDHIYKLVVIKR